MFKATNAKNHNKQKWDEVELSSQKIEQCKTVIMPNME